MRSTQMFTLAVSTGIAAVLAFASAASAAQRHRGHATAGHTITVKKRSFLDAGKVVPVGSESGYVTAGQYFTRTTDYYSQRSRYGNETLPGRFDLPNDKPLFRF